MKKDDVPDFKKNENIDLKICHWSNFAPHKSGLYETVKDMIVYENRIEGVLAGICDPAKPEGGQVDTNATDRDIVSQSHEWAMRDCNIHMVHYRETGFSARLKPKIFVTHGTVEACLESEMALGGEAGKSFTSSLDRIQNCDATIALSKKAQYYWSQFDRTNEKVKYVHKGIDLERFTPKGMKMELTGKPKIGYAETWRTIKHPLHTFYAVNEYHKNNPDMKFHPIGASQNWRLWHHLITLGNFHHLLGKYEMSMNQLYPEQWYRGYDMLLSPIREGEPSRVMKEALACGCPVITWDSNPFKEDTIAFRKAKYCNPFDMAYKIHLLWEEIQKDYSRSRTRARDIAEKHYSAERMANEIVGIAREVVEKC